MKIRALPLLFVAAILLLPSAPTEATGEQTLTGTYNSGFQNTPARVVAVFTPTGEELFDVEFDFSHNGRDLTYAGTAEGSLSEGELAGKVSTGTGGRVFTFRGEFKDGKFKGRHFEVSRRGRESETGPLTLKR